MLNRRSFFTRLAGVAAAIVGVKAATPTLDAADPETGISIRYIQNWDASQRRFNPARLPV